MMPPFERLVAVGGDVYGGGTIGNFWDSPATLLYVRSYRKRIFRETSFLHSEGNSDDLGPVVNRTPTAFEACYESARICVSWASCPIQLAKGADNKYPGQRAQQGDDRSDDEGPKEPSRLGELQKE
jgi:hypothetical protein